MTPPDPAQDPNGLQIQLNEDIAEGIYSNLVMIAHSPEEFILDFIRVMPGVPKAQVKTRVIVSPPHAKRLLAAMQDNIMKYEAQYGEITGPQQPNPPGGSFTFGTSGGEA